MDFDNLKVNGDTSTSDGLVVYANTVPKFVHLQVHFHEIPFKTILFISSIFPMVKGKIHYHPVWFLIETTFAYFSNHHLSKALKQLIKYITSFTEHSLTSIAFFITSSAALKRDGIYLCRLQVEIHFPTSSHDMRQMKVKVL